MTTTVPECVGASVRLVDPALRGAVDGLAPRVRRVAGYHLGWLDADGRELPDAHRHGGKRLRGAFALLSAQAAGAPAEVGVPAAVAVELVHNFSLLHDDVMDGDEERRHRPTAWTVFGTSDAILTGDAMLALAVEVLEAVPGDASRWATRCLLGSVQRLVVGQSLDVGFEGRTDVTVEECTQMHDGKTGALLACACSLGAVLADAPPPLALGLAQFGAHVGAAFQLVDDLLGIWGDPASTGKPVFADLRARKLSAPVAVALAHRGEPGEAGAAAAELGALYDSTDELDEAAVARAAELVERAGGRAWVERAAGERIALADTTLAGLDVPDEVERALRSLADYVTGRDR